jgi:hypothetical protein
VSLHDEDDDIVTPVPVDGREKETKILVLVVDGSDGGMKQGMNESM